MLGENNVVGEFQILFKGADCLRRIMVLVLEHGGIVVVVNHCQHSRLVLSHEFALHAPLLIWFDISLMTLRVEVNHLVEVAVSLSDTAVQEMSWFDFLDDINESELIQYLKERRLYVNEPVNANTEEA